MDCPNCDTYIYDAEIKDTEWIGMSCYGHMCGRCSVCGKAYTWVEVFTFSHIENIEEVQPDE